MQLLLYLFIGGVSMLVNMLCFAILIHTGVPLNYAIAGAFVVAALVNYILCILILFQHKARWNTAAEVCLYAISVAVMGLIDYGVTHGLLALACTALWAKFWASILGFAGNFILRRMLVFPNKKNTKKR
jgi:putative flippase GtrA